MSIDLGKLNEKATESVFECVWPDVAEEIKDVEKEKLDQHQFERLAAGLEILKPSAQRSLAKALFAKAGGE